MKHTVSFKDLTVFQVETDRYTDTGNKVWQVK